MVGSLSKQEFKATLLDIATCLPLGGTLRQLEGLDGYIYCATPKNLMFKILDGNKHGHDFLVIFVFRSEHAFWGVVRFQV